MECRQAGKSAGIAVCEIGYDWQAPRLPRLFWGQGAFVGVLVFNDKFPNAHLNWVCPSMSIRDTRRDLAKILAVATDAFQAASVIPHCAVCSRPCCKLDALVLELEWKQVKTFWRIADSRAAFDRKLASGNGPEEIRAANGLYYAHSKACPAYDEAGHVCTIYGQEIKPAGCSDFPVYVDQGSVMADLRCEAVDLGALVAELARAIGPKFRIVKSADREFPFLVTLSLKPVSAASAPGKRSRIRRDG